VAGFLAGSRITARNMKNSFFRQACGGYWLPLFVGASLAELWHVQASELRLQEVGRIVQIIGQDDSEARSYAALRW
jgi:hypothetical protein